MHWTIQLSFIQFFFSIVKALLCSPKVKSTGFVSSVNRFSSPSSYAIFIVAGFKLKAALKLNAMKTPSSYLPKATGLRWSSPFKLSSAISFPVAFFVVIVLEAKSVHVPATSCDASVPLQNGLQTMLSTWKTNVSLITFHQHSSMVTRLPTTKLSNRMALPSFLNALD